MRIGIYTQPLTTNYGGILQNYALQTVLKRLGHEVWTVDYYHYTWFDWFNRSIRILIHKLLGHSYPWAITPSAKNKKEHPLRRFMHTNISITTPRTKWFERSTILNYNFDALIVGSDQVWRPLYNSHVEDLFFAFASDIPVKKIAYAASFGTDEWEFTKQETQICSALAQQFNAVSVREQSGISLCNKHLGIESTCVLDPTLLLTSKDYSNLCESIPVQSAFVFAYILDLSEEKIAEIKRFAESKNLPLFVMSSGPNVGDDDSVEKWLSYFRDAAFVVTDSFHGTAFSIIFEKDFFVFGNKERGNSRFDSLLGMLNLNDRVIDNQIPRETAIAWSSLRMQLDRECLRSLAWLKKYLSNENS